MQTNEGDAKQCIIHIPGANKRNDTQTTKKKRSSDYSNNFSESLSKLHLTL